jgi:hypothetical protein
LFLGHKKLMTTRYEATYSNGPEPKTLIFSEGCYEALPFEVRLIAPWFGCFYIDGVKLKPAQRLEIMRQGYALVHESVNLQDAA